MSFVQDGWSPERRRDGPAVRHEATACEVCRKPFGIFFRRHHCRGCGLSLCHEHSGGTAPLPHLRITERVRVCEALKVVEEGAREQGELRRIETESR